MALPRWPDWDPAMKARDWTGSFERLGPYPPVGGTIDKPYTHKDIFKNNAMRLFARNFKFEAKQVLRCILPETSYLDWLWHGEGYRMELRELREELERAMFGSPRIIRIILEIAAEHDRDHASGLKFEDKSRFEREPFWKAGFTNHVFRCILSPLGDAIDTTKFLQQDSVWHKQYKGMFVTAAEVMYSQSSPSGQSGKGFLLMRGVYDAVRDKIDQDFKDRPGFYWVPVYVKEDKVTAGQKRKLEACIGMGLFDGMPGASNKVVLKKATDEVYPNA